LRLKERDAPPPPEADAEKDKEVEELEGGELSKRFSFEIEQPSPDNDIFDDYPSDSNSSESDESDFESDDVEYEGGRKGKGKKNADGQQHLIDDAALESLGKVLDKVIERDDCTYYEVKRIVDNGFNKWAQAYDRTAAWIQWLALFITFKFYRMTYSFFMGRK